MKEQGESTEKKEKITEREQGKPGKGKHAIEEETAASWSLYFSVYIFI